MQSNSDLDAIAGLMGYTFFQLLLGVALLPLSPSRRQHMEVRASELFDFMAAMTEPQLFAQRPVSLTDPEHSNLRSAWCSRASAKRRERQ